METFSERTKCWLFLRTLAKAFYSKTDKRGMKKEEFDDIISETIVKKTDELDMFTKFVEAYWKYLKEESDEITTDSTPYKVTNLIAFLQKYP